MAFRFRTIDYGFWRDLKREEVSFELQTFLAWLITNEHSHYSGLYYIIKPSIAHETDKTEEEVERDLTALTRMGYIDYDKETSFMWVKNMAKHQIKAGNAFNMIIGLNTHLKTVGSERLIADFVERYADLSATRKAGAETVEIEAPGGSSKPKPKPKKKAPKEPKPPKAPKKTDLVMEDFEKFYSIYPRREAPADAKKAWKSIEPDDELFKTIMEAIKTATIVNKWNDPANRTFVPLPATWLRAERWKDDLPNPGTAGTPTKVCSKENHAPKLTNGKMPNGWRHPDIIVSKLKDNISMATCIHCSVSFPC